MAKNLYKVISVFFHEKYCILRLVFSWRQVQLAFQTSGIKQPQLSSSAIAAIISEFA
jgi:hypothetical protein